MTIKELKEMINAIPTEFDNKIVTIDNEDADFIETLDWNHFGDKIIIIGE